MITVFRRWLAFSRGLQRCAEEIHLIAAIINIKLARHTRACRAQHSTERITNRRPARMPQVQRSGGVGADEFEVNGHAV